VLEGLGVSYLILAHLRYMGLAGCAQGLPCKTDFWQDLINQDQDPEVGLTDLGFEMLDAILASRIVLDVTHCSDLSRRDVMTRYRESGSKKPIISSHTGVRALADYELNVSDDWIKFICNSGGVIGVILFPFWLADNPSGRKGIDLVFDTIDYLRKVGCDDCVAIGTDLDGFIAPIGECRNYEEIPRLVELLQGRYAQSPEFVEKLLYKNAQRVISGSLP